MEINRRAGTELALGDENNIPLTYAMGVTKQAIVTSPCGLPPSPQYIEDLLSSSHCRRCGRCCLVNPLNPAHPGIEAFEDELKSISKYLHASYRSLKRKTRAGKELRNPLAPNEVAITRWLPLPCMFYDSKRNKCQVYEVRPLVCKLYPVTLEESYTSFAIKVNCEYGKDLYKNLIGRLKDKNSCLSP